MPWSRDRSGSCGDRWWKQLSSMAGVSGDDQPYNLYCVVQGGTTDERSNSVRWIRSVLAAGDSRLCIEPGYFHYPSFPPSLPPSFVILQVLLSRVAQGLLQQSKALQDLSAVHGPCSVAAARLKEGKHVEVVL